MSAENKPLPQKKPAKPELDDAFIDLVKTTKASSLDRLLLWNNFDLLVYFYHIGVSSDIIARLKESGCNGATFYRMGTRLDIPNKWEFFTKGGITDYNKLFRLEEVIRQYHVVCYMFIHVFHVNIILFDSL